GRVDQEKNEALIFDRGELTAGKHIERRREEADERAEDEYLRAIAQETVERTPILVGQGVKDPGHEPSKRALPPTLGRQTGAHDRGQRYRYHPGDDHGDRQGEGKLLEQNPGKARE